MKTVKEQSDPDPIKSAADKHLTLPTGVDRSGRGTIRKGANGNGREVNGYSAPVNGNGNRANGNGFASLGSNGFDSAYGAPGADEELATLAANIPGGGVPGEDYPVLSEVPDTGFDCAEQAVSGYYADTADEARCQVFHICQLREDGLVQKDSFLCPNGTLFNQQYLVCDWWINVDCSEAEEFYTINDEIVAAGNQVSSSIDGDYGRPIGQEQTEFGQQGTFQVSSQGPFGTFESGAQSQISGSFQGRPGQTSQAGQGVRPGQIQRPGRPGQINQPGQGTRPSSVQTTRPGAGQSQFGGQVPSQTGAGFGETGQFGQSGGNGRPTETYGPPRPSLGQGSSQGTSVGLSQGNQPGQSSGGDRPGTTQFGGSQAGSSSGFGQLEGNQFGSSSNQNQRPDAPSNQYLTPSVGSSSTGNRQPSGSSATPNTLYGTPV